MPLAILIALAVVTSLYLLVALVAVPPTHREVHRPESRPGRHPARRDRRQRARDAARRRRDHSIFSVFLVVLHGLPTRPESPSARLPLTAVRSQSANSRCRESSDVVRKDRDVDVAGAHRWWSIRSNNAALSSKLTPGW